MTLPKIVFSISLLLFGAISIAALLKHKNSEASTTANILPVQMTLEEVEVTKHVPVDTSQEQEPPIEEMALPLSAENLPQANRIEQFFQIYGDKLPIVETITYKSHVPWLKGRPAWLADYATHYRTSRHFIARSLNGKPDYFKQEIANGDRFNVLRQDKNFQFYLLADLLTCRLWFYYYDQDTDERVLIKTYAIGVGRPDPSSPSGYLTPVGKYQLGEKVGIYQPNTLALHRGERKEMIRTFGTRWIPFEKEIGTVSHSAKGLGIHGLPWKYTSNEELAEDTDSLSKYTSDGCLRLSTQDMEELFAIVISRPSVIELVKGFHMATLPGKEPR